MLYEEYYEGKYVETLPFFVLNPTLEDFFLIVGDQLQRVDKARGPAQKQNSEQFSSANKMVPLGQMRRPICNFEYQFTYLGGPGPPSQTWRRCILPRLLIWFHQSLFN